MKLKIKEVAVELGKSAKEIVDICKELGIEVRSINSSITPQEAQKIAEFIAKPKKKKEKKITPKEKKVAKVLKEKKVFFIDMSIDTMHTIERSFKIDFNDENYNHLQKAFVIYVSKKAKENLKNKLYYIDNLRDENV